MGVTDRTRIPRIMEKLEALWYDNPEWSFQQLIETGLRWSQSGLYFWDSEVEKRLDELIIDIAGA